MGYPYLGTWEVVAEEGALTSEACAVGCLA